MHRQATTDAPHPLAVMGAALAACPKLFRLPVPPQRAARARQFDTDLSGGSLRAAHPLPYRSVTAALAAADELITGTGGPQKEALVPGVPCSTLRAATEAGDSSGRRERFGARPLRAAGGSGRAAAGRAGRQHPSATVKTPSGSSTYWRHGPTALLSTPSGAAGRLRRR
ncbi:UDP-N-acetylglucosamine 2-epimerase [Streptomyces sp. ALI-76-A]|uniref:UDP-N-acetylglucosamine 2-epimerase n=1 Tax=Streptomyces sp. ALI-76-A TaxID=3025736 RepID=UPI00336502C2